MIRVLRDQHVRQQTRAGTPALDRAGWQRAAWTIFSQHAQAMLRADDPVHDEPPGNVFQLFGHILADRAQRAAAGAFIARAQHGVVARQFRR